MIYNVFKLTQQIIGIRLDVRFETVYINIINYTPVKECIRFLNLNDLLLVFIPGYIKLIAYKKVLKISVFTKKLTGYL